MNVSVDSTDATPLIDAHPTPQPRALRALLRLEALALSVCVVVFAAAGAVWGRLRPTYTLTVGDDGTVAAPESAVSSVEFAAFCSYLITVSAAAVIVVWVAFWVARRWNVHRFWTAAPLLMLANGAVGVCIFGSCVAWVSRLTWPLPDVEALQPGDSFDVVVEVPGLHGFIVVGLVIAVMCWLRLVWAVYSPQEDVEPDRG